MFQAGILKQNSSCSFIFRNYLDQSFSGGHIIALIWFHVEVDEMREIESLTYIESTSFPRLADDGEVYIFRLTNIA